MTTIRPSPSSLARERLTGSGAVMAAMVENTKPEVAWEAVVAAAKNPGMNISAIARELGLSSSPTTTRLRKAEQLGWLRITGKGGQPKRVYLTADAKAKLKDEQTGVTAIADAESRQSAAWTRPEFQPLAKGGTQPPRRLADIPRRDTSDPGHDLLKPTDDVKYPAIRALMAQSGELAQLADRLDSLGFADEALKVRSRLDALTPLESDVIRLMAEYGVIIEGA